VDAQTRSKRFVHREKFRGCLEYGRNADFSNVCPRERAGREYTRVFSNLIRNELARNTRRCVVARFRMQGVTYLRIYRRVISRDFREEAALFVAAD